MSDYITTRGWGNSTFHQKEDQPTLHHMCPKYLAPEGSENQGSVFRGVFHHGSLRCGFVCEMDNRHKCKTDADAERLYKRKRARDPSPSYKKATNDFLSNLAADFGLKPFLLKCSCSGRCSFGKVPRTTPSDEIRKKLEEHFKAVNPCALAKEAQVVARELKRKAEHLEKELQEGKVEVDIQTRSNQTTELKGTKREPRKTSGAEASTASKWQRRLRRIPTCWYRSNWQKMRC